MLSTSLDPINNYWPNTIKANYFFEEIDDQTLSLYGAPHGSARVTFNVTYRQPVKFYLAPYTLLYFYFIHKYYKLFEL